MWNTSCAAVASVCPRNQVVEASELRVVGRRPLVMACRGALKALLTPLPHSALALRAPARGVGTAAARGARDRDWLGAHRESPQSGLNAGIGLPARQRRILFRARQRGWLELDVLLGRWAAKHVAELRDEAAVARVEALLEAETPHLYEWIVGVSEPPPVYRDCEALKSLQEFARGTGVVEQR